MTKTAERGFGFIKAISEIIFSATQSVGRENEQYALEIALDLSQKGLIPHKKEKLPYLTEPWSDKDREGYDLMIPTDLEEEIGLQIKSSWVGKKLFIKHFLNSRDFPYIPCVVVRKDRSREEIIEEIRRICWREYYILQKNKGIKTTL